MLAGILMFLRRELLEGEVDTLPAGSCMNYTWPFEIVLWLCRTPISQVFKCITHLISLALQPRRRDECQAQYTFGARLEALEDDGVAGEHALDLRFH